jgi:lipoprotein-anchoring transpeptidase ErfK/SrfK
MSLDGSKVVERNVSANDVPPEGAVFEGADMPYWMRFNGAIGLHVGEVHRYSQSHGCVRVPEEACSILFEKLAVGSRVIVK